VVQQHIDIILCGFNRETLRVSAVFAAKWFTNWHSMTSTHYDSLIGYLQFHCIH